MSTSPFKGEECISLGGVQAPPKTAVLKNPGLKAEVSSKRMNNVKYFDLWYAFKHTNISSQEVVNIFYNYLE